MLVTWLQPTPNGFIQRKLHDKSFDFQTNHNTPENWREAVVLGIELEITEYRRGKKPRYNFVEFNIQVGVPIEDRNGRVFSKNEARYKAGESANRASYQMGLWANNIWNKRIWFGPSHELMIPKRFVGYMQANMQIDTDAKSGPFKYFDFDPDPLPGSRVEVVNKGPYNVIPKHAIYY